MRQANPAHLVRHEASERLAWLAEATRALQSGQSLDMRFSALFRLLHTVLQYRDARITCWLQSAQPGTRRCQFTAPTPQPELWDDGLTRQVALGGQLLRRELPPGGMRPAWGGVYLGAPIIWGGRLWGVLELRAERTQDLQQAEQEFVLALLPQLAAAIAGAGMHDDTAEPGGETGLVAVEGPEQQAQLLSRMRDDLEGLQTLHEVLTLVLQCALAATGAEAGAINLVDEAHGELVLQVHTGYPDGMFGVDLHGVPRQRWSWDTGLAGRAARSGRALLVRDVGGEPDARLRTGLFTAELAAPIVLDDRVLAVIVLDSGHAAAFGEAELAFVSRLCERAARPLQRALRYQELIETSTQLGQVFGSLTTGLALLDGGGRVLRMNPAWATIWGLSQRVNGQAFHVPIDLIEALLPRLPEPLQLTEFCALCQRTPAEVQQTLVRLSNPTQELKVVSVPTRDSLNQVTGRLWVVSDVTREREVDRLKDEFVSIVSHELRTPLTSILGYTELLLARDFAPVEQKQFNQTVYDQALHLSQLVEDLLSVSRLEAGRVKLNRWVVALRQLVFELTNQLNAQIERHRLLIRLVDPLPPVFVDRDKVKQILFNLLNNAVKYDPDGGEIELAVCEAHMVTGIRSPLLPDGHPPGRWVVVSVRDQGIGIAPEDVERIWERFYRVDNTNTRRIGGTGLGLSITRALVELHGGRIWLESDLGKGSMFAFSLPVAGEKELGVRSRQ